MDENCKAASEIKSFFWQINRKKTVQSFKVYRAGWIVFHAWHSAILVNLPTYCTVVFIKPKHWVRIFYSMPHSYLATQIAQHVLPPSASWFSLWKVFSEAGSKIIMGRSLLLQLQHPPIAARMPLVSLSLTKQDPNLAWMVRIMISSLSLQV